jgi:hypothetical protein
MVIFDLSHRSIFRIFHTVICWINRTFSYPLLQALVDEDVNFFSTISEDFSNSPSDGVFTGCIGALDGLAIEIKKPTLSSSIRDPGSYYCRKGFHALNCQAICDSNKKLLWISTEHQGSCHDSAAFTATTLYRVIQKKRDFLHNNRFFLAADSAYSMEFFVLVPYERPSMMKSDGQMEDAYKFYHSNCRIRIECTFGEVVMRWGIFWRKLQMDIAAVGEVISAEGLLHNFIIDERDSVWSNNYISSFSHSNLRVDNDRDPEVHVAMVADHNEPKPSGRPSNSDALFKEKGRNMRRALCWSLDSNQLTRPTQSGFKYNRESFVSNSDKWLVWIYLMDMKAGFLLFSVAKGKPSEYVGCEPGSDVCLHLLASDDTGSAAGTTNEEGSITLHPRKRSAIACARKDFEARQVQMGSLLQSASNWYQKRANDAERREEETRKRAAEFERDCLLLPSTSVCGGASNCFPNPSSEVSLI